MIDRKKCKDYLQDFCATYREVEDVIDALRSLNAEEEITDEEYDYIMENYDELANGKEEERGMTRERLLEVLDGVLSWGNDHDKEFRECLIYAMGLTCDELKELGLVNYVNDDYDDEEDEEYTIFDTRQEAEEYLDNLAAEDGCWNYEIVEDNYEIPNGLLLIEYLDKDREHEDRHYLVGYKHECPEDEEN